MEKHTIAGSAGEDPQSPVQLDQVSGFLRSPGGTPVVKISSSGYWVVSPAAAFFGLALGTVVATRRWAP